MRLQEPWPVLRAYRQEDPEADPDAGRGDHRSPVVPVQAVLHQALLPASPEVSHPVEPAALRPVLREALQESLEESLQREALPAPAVYRAPAGGRRQDAAVSHHARPARPGAHPADAVVQAQSMVHRPAVSRSMEQVRHPELAEAALPGAQPEELSVQVAVSARVRPSELPQVAAAEAQLSERREAVSAQPWVQPEEAAAEVLPSVVRVVEAVQPWAAQAAVEVQRAVVLAEEEVQRGAVPAVEEERPAAERAAEAARLLAGQAAVPVRPSEARAELPSAEPSVRSDRQARVPPVR